MPILTIYRDGKNLNRSSDQALAKSLTLVTHECLSKSIEHTVINYVDLSSSYREEGVKDSSILTLEIKITAGTNTEAEKSSWIANVWTVLQTYFPELDKSVIYLSIIELNSNSWGYNGLTQKERAITGVKNEIL